jgi:hypothetical protein
VKSGAVTTANDTVIVCVNVPLTAVIVIGKLPVAVFTPVVTDNVDESVAGFRLKFAEAPLGSPLAEKFTCPLKPPLAVIVTL